VKLKKRLNEQDNEGQSQIKSVVNLEKLEEENTLKKNEYD
jgi:hypothetical protein